MNYLILLTNKELLEDFSRGLIRSFNQIYIVFIVIISFILIVILISQISRYKEKKELKIILNKKYDTLIEKLKINLNEKEIIEKLSKYLKNPEKKYLLLLYPNLFHSTLNKLRESIIKKYRQHLDEKILSSLERKVGFSRISQYSELISTYDLPEGMSVYVIIDENHKGYGKIIYSEESLKIRLDIEIKGISIGQEVTIYTHNYTGVYVFHAILKRIEKNILFFEHTKRIKSLQRRNYFRRKVFFPVLIEKPGDSNKPIGSILYDISGGGASIDNTKLGLKPHDDFRITFPNNNILTLYLDAEVIRCSKDGKIIHIMFNHLKPSVQDRIIRLINK